MTDFCPYESGILDTVTQLLVPPIVGDLESKNDGENISDEGRQFSLTPSDDQNLHLAVANQRKFAWKYVRRGGGGGLHVSQLRPLLEGLDVPFADEDEAESVEDLLDPGRTGCLCQEDVVAFAAKRLVARRRAVESQTTAPGDLLQERDRRMRCRGLRAELYKLNVYSGPAGVFKPHVDTPRSASQIGSLVVCLPVEFSGGGLAVRHQGQEIVHEWGTRVNNNDDCTPAAAASALSAEAAPAINWTAFYSDCEHEVLPVHSGHRITLTYNLFLSRGTGLLNTPLLPQRLLPHHLPLAPHLYHALANPHFKPEGGYLAFWLRHRYPLTHPVECEFVVEMLKGADLGMVGAVRAVGLRCSVERVEHFAGGRDVLDAGVWGRLEGRGMDDEDRMVWGAGGRGMVPGGLSGGSEEEVEAGYAEEIPSSLCPLEIGDDPLNEGDYSEPVEDDFDVEDSDEDSDADMDDRHPIVGDVVTRLRRQKKERLTWIGREGRPAAEVSGVYLAVSLILSLSP